MSLRVANSPDSLASEIVTPSGSASAGYAATFQVGIAA
jgi:hypothetical protein